jgi:hypothetical protein
MGVFEQSTERNGNEEGIEEGIERRRVEGENSEGGE